MAISRDTLGPQVVGGTYHCGYWLKDYEVLEITPINAWDFEITVRWLDDGRIVTHRTAWDYKRDRVIV